MVKLKIGQKVLAEDGSEYKIEEGDCLVEAVKMIVDVKFVSDNFDFLSKVFKDKDIDDLRRYVSEVYAGATKAKGAAAYEEYVLLAKNRTVDSNTFKDIVKMLKDKKILKEKVLDEKTVIKARNLSNTEKDNFIVDFMQKAKKKFGNKIASQKLNSLSMPWNKEPELGLIGNNVKDMVDYYIDIVLGKDLKEAEDSKTCPEIVSAVKSVFDSEEDQKEVLANPSKTDRDKVMKVAWENTDKDTLYWNGQEYKR